jgi:carbon monoxide dehydrogenase subunit G
LKIAGTAQLPFTPERTYDLMQDPVLLAKAIPGCDALEKIGEDEYSLQMKMVMASLSGAFEGKVRLTEPDRPVSFRMLVEGTGKIGFMKGDGLLRLTANEAGTEVSYEGEAQIGGKIAAVGNRMIDMTARMLIKRFFEKLAAEKPAEPAA